MDSPKSFEAKFQRLLAAINGGASDLARELKIHPSSVGAAKKRKQIPSGWVETIADKHGIDANWLFFGVGSMLLDQSITPSEQKNCHPAQDTDEDLRQENRELRQENRELRQENRDIVKKNITLIEQNAELRIELEVLKLRPDKSEKTNEADLRRSA